MRILGESSCMVYTYYEGFVETNILCTGIIAVGRITVIIIIIISTHGLRYKGSPARWVATKIMYDYYWASSTLVLRDVVIIILILTCEHHVTIPSTYRIIIKVKSWYSYDILSIENVRDWHDVRLDDKRENINTYYKYILPDDYYFEYMTHDVYFIYIYIYI